jgi:hypothetical protein
MDLHIGTNVDSIKKIEERLKFLERISLLQKDRAFQLEIQKKCLDTLYEVMNRRINSGTTNTEEIELYRTSNHLVEIENGFIIYNDAKIPADKYNTLPFDTSGYPNGEFSIALAFEYGVGVVGISSYGTSRGYIYNDVGNSKSKRRKGDFWWLPNNVPVLGGERFRGYEGFEIYRFTAEEINKNMKNWVFEYLNR